jgi:carbonic anhydrase/acetyltransferase-like protein (isoleucine patch superfamily)
MIATRMGRSPVVAATARVAPGAHVVGNVVLEEHCVVDVGAVLASSGPPITVGEGAVVMPGAVIRSVGGEHRPAFPTTIGAGALIGPAAVLAGCDIGQAVYVATQAMVFQGARVGAGSRLGAGCIVHTGAVLAPRSRVGMRQFAVPDEHGGPAVITSDLDVARRHLGLADFFGRVFELEDEDPVELHRRSVDVLRREAADWDQGPLERPPDRS